MKSKTKEVFLQGLGSGFILKNVFIHMLSQKIIKIEADLKI